MRTVRLGLFTPSVVVDVARVLGRFDTIDVAVEEHLVASSPDQFRALAAGELDLVVTSPDNVLLYTGFDDNPLGGRLPLTITAALDRGLGLSLWTRPGLDPDDARVLGVDVPVSGFALAARALLARHGIRVDEVRALGSTPRRRLALSRGECDVTILGAGNELCAAEDGCRLVATVDELGDYLGAVLCRLDGESGDARAAADAVAGAVVELSAEIVAGAHAESVIDAAQRVLDLTPTAAAHHLEVLRAPTTGLVADGRLRRAPLETLARLREGRQDADALRNAVNDLLARASGPAR